MRYLLVICIVDRLTIKLDHPLLKLHRNHNRHIHGRILRLRRHIRAHYTHNAHKGGEVHSTHHELTPAGNTTSTSSSVVRPKSANRPCDRSATRPVVSFGPQSAGNAAIPTPVRGFVTHATPSRNISFGVTS